MRSPWRSLEMINGCPWGYCLLYRLLLVSPPLGFDDTARQSGRQPIVRQSESAMVTGWKIRGHEGAIRLLGRPVMLSHENQITIR